MFRPSSPDRLEPDRRGDAIAEARALLASHAPQKAATLLEDALAEAGPTDRAAIVELLRQSYRDLIAQSEAAGKSRETALYRDNLAILDQAKVAGPSAPAPFPVPVPVPEPRKPLPISPPVATGPAGPGVTEARRLPRSPQAPDLEPAGEPPALPEPGPVPSPALEGPAPPRAPREAPAASIPGPQKEPQTLAPSPSGARGDAAGLPRIEDQQPPAAAPPATATAAVDDDLSRADQLFTARKYEDAGQIYARLAGQNRLPAQRRQIWAYCRWVGVVARINAHPRTDREWDAIEQEIRSVQRLTPGNWYGEYLQNRVAEARRGGRSSGRAGKVVVRGSAPEEAPERETPRAPGKPRPAPTGPVYQPGEESLGLPSLPAAADTPPEADAGRPQARAPRLAPSPPESDTTGALAAAQPPVEGPGVDPATPSAPPAWHVRETANFAIYHTDAGLAEQAGKAAEAVRALQAKRWGSSATRTSWNPRCEIYLYPTSRQFAQMTGQPESSPGFSTMGMSGTRVTARRVNLRADHPQMLEAILPHEVTHVVLADLFTQQQIPRWADEGMAVLAEPVAEQHSRAADLTAPLKEGRVFKLSDLMAIDYPNADAWSLYYAQSVSLTQFLVQLGTPEKFVSFVRSAQRSGIEASLKSVYKIDGFPDLEDRWQQFALRQAGELTASRRELSLDDRADPAAVSKLEPRGSWGRRSRRGRITKRPCRSSLASTPRGSCSTTQRPTSQVEQAATDLAGDRFIGLSSWRWADLHGKTGGTRCS